MSVEMNKENWSNSSKRSYAYSQSTDTHYEDFGYYCVKCKCHCVFSAEDQKIEYEENKRFIWHKKTLCANCQLRIDTLREKDRQFRKRWAMDRNILKTDRQFLCDWLAILEEIPMYGKKSHSNLIVTLQKLSYGCTELELQK